MASFWTNRGAVSALDLFARTTSPVVTDRFKAVLALATPAPTVDTITFTELSEIAAGNGYTSGGLDLLRNATDFDVLTEDVENDRALVQAKDLAWTAAGGSIPSSGAGARYLVLTDDHVTLGSREVLAVWDLVSDRTVSDGQTLTIQDAELRLQN